jgi:hypothetical protein
MADAVCGIIGTVILMGYLYLIADKLNELPLWICVIIGVILMIYSFWIDAWRPWLMRDQNPQ